MGSIASQNTSLTSVYSIVYSDADQRKHQSSAPLAFVRGIHRWIPRTNGQERGKCFHLMTSSCRHRAAHGTYTRACPCWVSATTAPIHINLKYLKWHCLIENIIFVYPLDQIAFWQSATCDTSNTYGKRFNKISNHPNNSSPFEFFYDRIKYFVGNFVICPWNFMAKVTGRIYCQDHIRSISSSNSCCFYLSRNIPFTHISTFSIKILHVYRSCLASKPDNYIT